MPEQMRLRPAEGVEHVEDVVQPVHEGV